MRTGKKKAPFFFALGHPDDRADGGVTQTPVKSVEERKDFTECSSAMLMGSFDHVTTEQCPHKFC